MTDLTNPHDATFRDTFGDPKQAAALLRGALPARVTQAVDWDTLTLLDGNLFFGVELVERRADLLYSVQLHEGHEICLYAILEHQSSPDRWMPVRVLERQVGVTRRLLRDNPSLEWLPLVIPIVIYHGPSKWNTSTRMLDLAPPEIHAHEFLLRYVPGFEVLLWDLVKEDDAGLAAKVDAPLACVVLAFLKHAAYEPDLEWLRPWLPRLAMILSDPYLIERVNQIAPLPVGSE